MLQTLFIIQCDLPLCICILNSCLLVTMADFPAWVDTFNRMEMALVRPTDRQPARAGSITYIIPLDRTGRELTRFRASMEVYNHLIPTKCVSIGDENIDCLGWSILATDLTTALKNRERTLHWTPVPEHDHWEFDVVDNFNTKAMLLECRCGSGDWAGTFMLIRGVPEGGLVYNIRITPLKTRQHFFWVAIGPHPA